MKESFNPRLISAKTPIKRIYTQNALVMLKWAERNVPVTYERISKEIQGSGKIDLRETFILDIHSCKGSAKSSWKMQMVRKLLLSSNNFLPQMNASFLSALDVPSYVPNWENGRCNWYEGLSKLAQDGVGTFDLAAYLIFSISGSSLIH